MGEGYSQTDRQWCRRECWVKRTKDRTVEANSYTPPPSLLECTLGGKHGWLGVETGLCVGVGVKLCECVGVCVCVSVCPARVSEGKLLNPFKIGHVLNIKY